MNFRESLGSVAGGKKSLCRGCFGDNKLFRRLRRDGFRIHVRRLPGIEIPLESLLPDPDKAFEGAQIFKPGTRTHAGRIEVAGRSYFLKRYNDRGPWYRVRHLLKRSRAIRTWGVTWGFVEREVPVPRPLLCIEERRLGLLRRSYILMEFAAAARPLRTVWPDLQEQGKTALLSFLGETLGRMHHRGCLHGDLKWDNVLVEAKGGGWSVTLVDLDGSSLLRSPRKGVMTRDVDRFLKDLRRYDGRPEMLEAFLSAWQRLTRWS